MRALLHIKAFPLFLLTSGPLVFLVIHSLILKRLDFGFAGGLQMISEYAILVSNVISYCWFYVLGVELHKKLPADQPMNLVFYKVLISIGVAVLIIQQVMPALQSGHYLPLAGYSGFALIYTISALSLAVGILMDIWLARVLTSVENQRAVRWGDYYGTLFSFLFYFIGVFWIQPSVNKLFADEAPVEPGGPIDQL